MTNTIDDDIKIDLKWILWSKHREDFLPEHIARMEAAFSGSADPITISTSPRKENRSGKVKVFPGRAEVTFEFDWDDPFEQVWRVKELIGDLSKSEADAAADHIGDYFAKMQWSVSENLSAESIDELLAKIDQVERNLVELEDQQADAFESEIRSLADYLLDERKTTNNQKT